MRVRRRTVRCLPSSHTFKFIMILLFGHEYFCFVRHPDCISKEQRKQKLLFCNGEFIDWHQAQRGMKCFSIDLTVVLPLPLHLPRWAFHAPQKDCFTSCPKTLHLQNFSCACGNFETLLSINLEILAFID